jgi:hypothetical protein
MPLGEMVAKDVLQVVRDGLEIVDEELPFGLEVSKLKDQVDRHRNREHAIDQFPLRRAQIEVKAAIVFGEAWQAIKVFDLMGGQNR